MSHLTAKNQLQEIYQKQKLQLPIYTHIKVENGWISTVTLHDGTQITGTPRNKKTDADIAVAAIILDKYKHITNNYNVSKLSTIPNSNSEDILKSKPIIKIDPKHRSNYTLTKKVVMLLDLENMPNLLTSIISEELDRVENFHIFVFVGEHHPLATKINHNSNIKYIISPSTRKDGTDACIQMVAGMMLINKMFDHYMIATRDHFGGSVVDLIKNSIVSLPKQSLESTKDGLYTKSNIDLNFSYLSRTATIVTTIDHIITELTNLRK